jgi:hypothetical protein
MEPVSSYHQQKPKSVHVKHPVWIKCQCQSSTISQSTTLTHFHIKKDEEWEVLATELRYAALWAHILNYCHDIFTIGETSHLIHQPDRPTSRSRRASLPGGVWEAALWTRVRWNWPASWKCCIDHVILSLLCTHLFKSQKIWTYRYTRKFGIVSFHTDSHTNF